MLLNKDCRVIISTIYALYFWPLLKHWMKLCSGSTTDQNDGVAPVPFHRNEELRLCVVVLYMNLSCSIPSTLGDYVEMRGHCTISNTHLYTTILCTVPKLVTYVLLKFSSSEKAAKIGVIFRLIWHLRSVNCKSSGR